MMEIIVGIGSFLGGGFLTTIIFIIGYTSQFATMKNSVKNIEDKLKGWETNGMPTCALHRELEKRIRDIEIKDSGQN